MKTVSIVVPTYNGAERIQRLLASIEKFAVAELKEIVLCDDGSDDRVRLTSGKLPDKLPITKVRQDRAGARRASARNLGLAAATGDIVLFLDDDCLIGRRTIRSHVWAHSRTRGAVAIGYRARLTRDAGSARITLDHRRKLLGACGRGILSHPAPWSFAYTCNLSISGRARRLRFDDSFSGWGYEDLEYGYRLFKAGIPFRGASGSTVWHVEDRPHDPFRAADGGQDADFSEAALNAVRLLLKHGRDPQVQELILDDLEGLAIVSDRCLRRDRSDPPETIISWARGRL
jgi:glycosyltransferase involved in cell wall biosynthesis